MTELTYTKNGDYLIPDLTLSETPEDARPLGKYGRLRRSYLQEHRPGLYSRLVLSEKLFPHLREIDETANRRLEQMMPELMKSAGVTEELSLSEALAYRDDVFLRIPFGKVKGCIDSRHESLAAEWHEKYGYKNYNHPKEDFQLFFSIHNYILNTE